MRLVVIMTAFLVLTLIACSSEKSKTEFILDNKIEISTPKEFHYSQKKFHEKSLIIDINHKIDYFTNQDSSKEISFIKLPVMNGSIDLKTIAELSMASTASEVFFKGEKIINGIKIYITEYVGFDEGKEKYMKMIYFPLENEIIMGNFSCSPKYKASWSKQSTKIIKSIKKNK